jgi:hypothetical protein
MTNCRDLHYFPNTKTFVLSNDSFCKIIIKKIQLLQVLNASWVRSLAENVPDSIISV